MSDLIEAAAIGDLSAVQAAIRRGEDVNTKTELGYTALLRAAKYGYTDIIRELLLSGAKLDLANYNGNTALIEAAMNGHIEAARALLSSGANVDQADTFGNTALMIAAEYGHADTMAELLSSGATVDLENKSGDNALIWAARYGHTENVRRLISAGADVVKVGSKQYSKYGRIAVTAACENGYIDAVKELFPEAVKVAEVTEIINNTGFLSLQHGDTTLILAARIGHTDKVRELLSLGASVDLANKNGNTALIEAAKSGQLDTVKEILSSEANVDLANVNGETALILATKNGHIHTVRELLSSGATVDLADKDGDSALTLAIKSGHTDIARELVSSEDQAGVNGDTSLMKAAGSNDTDTLRKLLRFGVDVDQADKFGVTALMKAAMNGHTEAMRELLSSGATVDLADNNGETALMKAVRTEAMRELLSSGATVDLVDNAELIPGLLALNLFLQNGETALMKAVRDGHASAVRELVSSGASVDLANNDAETALMIAISYWFAPVVRELLKSGATVDLTDGYGNTALMKAVLEGSTHIVEQLLSSKAKVDLANKNGDTALIWAVMFCHTTDIFRKLLSSGANVDQANESGWTALMKAAEYGFADVAEELLSSGATVDLADINGETALMKAAKHGHAAAIQVLLSSGATVDLADESGNTALIWAAFYGFTVAVKELVSSGAMVDRANKRGYTALILAAWSGSTDTVRELLLSGATMDLSNKKGKTALMIARGDTLSLLEEAKKSSLVSPLPQPEIQEEPPQFVPVLPRNWMIVTHQETDKPVYHNVKTKEDIVFIPPGYPLQQTSIHPNVTFYDEPQEKEFMSTGSHEDFKNGVEITIPPHTIPPGSTVGIKVQPSLAPNDVFVMPHGIESASPAYLITSKDATLDGDVTLTMEHHLDLKTQKEADNLVFLEADSSPRRSGSKSIYEYQEVRKSRSEFIPGEKKGRLSTSLKHLSNKFIKVGVKIKKFFHGLKPHDHNLYTVRVYRSPPQTTGIRIAVICISLQGQLYSKFLDVLDKVILPRDYPDVSTQVADKTTIGSLHFEEICATLSVLSVEGWSAEPDKDLISMSEVNQPETEHYKPEDLHDYPPRILCRFFPKDNAPKRATCTLSFAGLKPEVKVHIPLMAPQVNTAVDTRTLQEAADELRNTVITVKDTRLAGTVNSVVSLMERMAAALQSSSSLGDLANHTNLIKSEVDTILRVCEEVAKECKRQIIKENISVSLTKIEVLSHQLWQVTKVKLKHCKDPLEEVAALVDLVKSGASLMRTVDCLLKDIQTLTEITSMSVEDTKLNCEVEEKDLYHLGGCFDTIEGYLDQLGLTAGQQTDIRKKDYLHGTQVAMSEALKMWRDQNPFSATFKVLVDILLDMQKGSVAVQVCKYCVGR